MNLSKNKLFLIVSLSTLIIGASVFTIFFYKTEEKALPTKSAASKAKAVDKVSLLNIETDTKDSKPSETNNNGTNGDNTQTTPTFDVKADLNRFYFAVSADKDAKGKIASVAADGSDYRVEYENIANLKRNFVYSHASKRAAFINNEDKITLIDLNNPGSKPIPIMNQTKCLKLMFTPNGEELICFESKSKYDVCNMIFFDSVKLERQDKKTISGVPAGLLGNSAFETEGKSIVFAYEKICPKYGLARFSLETKDVTTICSDFEEAIQSTDLSYDGKKFVSVSDPSEGQLYITIFDLETQEVIKRTLDFRNGTSICSIVWSRDGKRLFGFINDEKIGKDSNNYRLHSLELDDTRNLIEPKPILNNEDKPVLSTPEYLSSGL